MLEAVFGHRVDALCAHAADLIALITGLALATEHRPNPAAEANRLLALTLRGISPHA
ncbi:hypothetical protein [Streptomyces sp. NPDC058401]|uniref:hypothetical protein n=1 Tax=Streptomyces sp. NPDC058401 TaxID=3346480 RepID=UPI00365A33D2